MSPITACSIRRKTERIESRLMHFHAKLYRLILESCNIGPVLPLNRQRGAIAHDRSRFLLCVARDGLAISIENFDEDRPTRVDRGIKFQFPRGASDQFCCKTSCLRA